VDGEIVKYSLSIPQSASLSVMSSAPNGVSLAPHSIYVEAYGGDETAIAQAILTKKNPGCNYNGNTTVTVSDTNSLFSAPYPSYPVSFEVPTPTPILFSVAMQSNRNVPQDAIPQIKAAIIAAFNGEDGKGKARIAGEIFAQRFYAAIGNLGAWALMYSLQLGIDAADQNCVQMRADQIPTIDPSNIAVTFS
jgi:hypothetical protein